jgi:hypothetical protein
MIACPGPATGTHTPPINSRFIGQDVIFFGGGFGGSGGAKAEHAPVNHAKLQTVKF